MHKRNINPAHIARGGSSLAYAPQTLTFTQVTRTSICITPMLLLGKVGSIKNKSNQGYIRKWCELITEKWREEKTTAGG